MSQQYLLPSPVTGLSAEPTPHGSVAPFPMPRLPLPTDARLSQHRATASERAVTWAREHGMLDGSVWSEQDLREHDYGLMCAYIHPDADADELALITQWYVWVFFFDDHFLERFKKTGDRAGAIAHVDAILARLGATPTQLDTVPAADPVLSGLADLWARTLPDMSPAWRRRFTVVTADLVEQSLTELDTITSHRVPDPIEYIGLRRRVGGAPWSAALVEHTVGEIPPDLIETRPLRVLTDTFTDAVHLRNDLFSYERETGQEGEPHNAVLVTERFLGCAPQRAADLVADLITSRLSLSEKVLRDELPALFAEHGTPLEQRTRVLAYAQGLRDWQSGGHAWHARSSRYTDTGARRTPPPRAPGPAGPGITTARPARPVTGTRPWPPRLPGELPPLRHRPDLHIPFEVRHHPALPEIRRQHLDWTSRLGLFDPLREAGGIVLWLPQDLADFDFALCAAGVFPDAEPEFLALCADWFTITWLDDYFPTVLGRAGYPAALAFVHSVEAMLDDPGRRPPATHPAHRLFAGVWDRTTAGMTTEHQQALRAGVNAYLRSNLWELEYNRDRTVPDAVDFMEVSRSTFGGDFMVALSHIRHPRVPADVWGSAPLAAFDAAVQDVFRLMNELLSYTKETQFEHEVINGLVVYGHLLGQDPDTTATTLAGLVQARVAHIQRLVEVDIPALCDRRGLSDDAREDLLAHTRDMRHWISSVYYWHRQTPRYNDTAVAARYRRRRLHRLTPIRAPRTAHNTSRREYR